MKTKTHNNDLGGRTSFIMMNKFILAEFYMKKIIWVSLVCFVLQPAFGSEIRKQYEKKMAEKRAEFKKNPSKKGFDEVVQIGNEWIKQEPLKSRPYFELNLFYMNDGTNILDLMSAQTNALAVINRFLKHPEISEHARKAMSECKKAIEETIEAITLQKQTEKKSASFPPQSVIDAQILFGKYAKSVSFGKENIMFLDNAIAILEKDKEMHSTDIRVYKELIRLYSVKFDYEHAYETWKVIFNIKGMVNDIKEPLRSIIEARKLYAEYVKQISEKDSKKIIGEAIAILEKDKRKRSSDYRIYQELAKLYIEKHDYMYAYLNWKIASVIGDKKDPVFTNINGTLYLHGASYGIKNKVSRAIVGDDFEKYFFWVEREAFLSLMSASEKVFMLETNDNFSKIIKKHRTKRDEKRRKNKKLYKMHKEEEENAEIKRKKMEKEGAELKKGNLPPLQSVTEAKELYEKYMQQKQDTNLLNKAILVLETDKQKRTSDYRIYQTLVSFYVEKGDYLFAYLNWKIASVIGNTKDPVFVKATKTLCLKGMKYKQSHAISKKVVGDNSLTYFLWLQKDEFLNSLSKKDVLDLK